MAEEHTGPASRQAAAFRKAPFYLQLRSIEAGDKFLYTVSLESDLLTLLGPDDRAILKLHRDEAARYVQFAYDLFRGWTLSFTLIEGLKRYVLLCARDQMMKLLAWMPHLTQVEAERQIRYAGIGVALMGLFHVLVPSRLFWLWGAWLIGAGALGVLRPRRFSYGINAALLFGFGLWDLLAGSPHELRPWNVSPDQRVIPVVVGTVLILWSVQQISMLSPNQQLRAARGIRDRHAAFLPERSRVVRRIAFINLAAAILFATYAIGVAVAQSSGGIALGGLSLAFREAVVFGVLAAAMGGSSALMLLRKRPAYIEAKAAGQALLAILVFSAWGLVLNVTRAGFAGVFATGLGAFTSPYLWVSLMACVLVFNRWYVRAVDRELEEQRG